MIYLPICVGFVIQITITPDISRAFYRATVVNDAECVYKYMYTALGSDIMVISLLYYSDFDTE